MFKRKAVQIFSPVKILIILTNKTLIYTYRLSTVNVCREVIVLAAEMFLFLFLLLPLLPYWPLLLLLSVVTRIQPITLSRQYIAETSFILNQSKYYYPLCLFSSQCPMTSFKRHAAVAQLLQRHLTLDGLLHYFYTIFIEC